MSRQREIHVRQGDLTEGHELLMVNASNTNGTLDTGVSGAIRRACGKDFAEEIRQELYRRYRGPMPPGHVIITSAGAHPVSRYVAHVAVMDYRHGFHENSYPTESLIHDCYSRLWEAIEELPEEPASISVGVVALGAGTGKLGVRLPITRACVTLAAHLEAHPDSTIGDVVFYGFKLPDYITVIEVVSEHFSLSHQSIPEELRSYLFEK